MTTHYNVLAVIVNDGAPCCVEIDVGISSFHCRQFQHFLLLDNAWVIIDMHSVIKKRSRLNWLWCTFLLNIVLQSYPSLAKLFKNLFSASHRKCRWQMLIGPNLKYLVLDIWVFQNRSDKEAYNMFNFFSLFLDEPWAYIVSNIF